MKALRRILLKGKKIPKKKNPWKEAIEQPLVQESLRAVKDYKKKRDEYERKSTQKSMDVDCPKSRDDSKEDLKDCVVQLIDILLEHDYRERVPFEFNSAAHNEVRREEAKLKEIKEKLKKK